MGVCHRDIKLDNIMFKDNSHKEIKLIDFGLASKMKRRVNL